VETNENNADAKAKQADYPMTKIAEQREHQQVEQNKDDASHQNPTPTRPIKNQRLSGSEQPQWPSPYVRQSPVTTTCNLQFAKGHPVHIAATCVLLWWRQKAASGQHTTNTRSNE
jgi:hypothetical protein